MKIQNKVALLTSVWLLIILVFVNVFVGIQFIRLTVKNQVGTLLERAQNIKDDLSTAVLLEKNQEQAIRKYLPSEGLIRILDSQGAIRNQLYEDKELLQVTPKFDISPGYVLERFASPKDKSILFGQELILVVTSPLYVGTLTVGSIEIAVRQSGLEQSLAILLYVLLLSTFGALSLSVLGGILVSRYIVKPITRMIETMEQVESSMTFKRLPVPAGGTRDELDKLSSTFNRMMDRLEESFLKQRQFVSDASHEFKTMLTIMESYAHMLQRWGTKDENVLREGINVIYNESVRMKKMTQQLLDLASSGTESAFAVSQFNLVQLCHETAKLMEKLYDRDVKVNAKESVYVEGDPLKIKQLLMILLDNALKYSQKPVKIRVAYSDPEQALLQIIDYGIGIPKEEKDLIFERFYRVDKARQRKTGGTGLGLPIAKALVKQHKGTIQIHSEENQGTEVSIHLPRKAAQEPADEEPGQQ